VIVAFFFFFLVWCIFFFLHFSGRLDLVRRRLWTRDRILNPHVKKSAAKKYKGKVFVQETDMKLDIPNDSMFQMVRGEVQE